MRLGLKTDDGVELLEEIQPFREVFGDQLTHPASRDSSERLLG